MRAGGLPRAVKAYVDTEKLLQEYLRQAIAPPVPAPSLATLATAITAGPAAAAADEDPTSTGASASAARRKRARKPKASLTDVLAARRAARNAGRPGFVSYTGPGPMPEPAMADWVEPGPDEDPIAPVVREPMARRPDGYLRGFPNRTGPKQAARIDARAQRMRRDDALRDLRAERRAARR